MYLHEKLEFMEFFVQKLLFNFKINILLEYGRKIIL